MSDEYKRICQKYCKNGNSILSSLCCRCPCSIGYYVYRCLWWWYENDNSKKYCYICSYRSCFIGYCIPIGWNYCWLYLLTWWKLTVYKKQRNFSSIFLIYTLYLKYLWRFLVWVFDFFLDFGSKIYIMPPYSIVEKERQYVLDSGLSWTSHFKLAHCS